MRQFYDEGSLGASTLAVTGSASSTILAAGSKSGNVNIYQDTHRNMPAQASIGAETLQPVKTLTHLTTVVDSMAFSSDGQILVMASRMKRDALRLIHVPTMTAFSNWPTSKSPIHYVHSVAFSPSTGYVAIGNARGRVIMYRLHHYPGL
jgi:U3 small nucleolar RNA-associated protein 18